MFDNNLLAKNKDIFKQSEVNQYQIHLRLGFLEKDIDYINDCLPPGLIICINRHYFPLPPFPPMVRTGVLSRRLPDHMDITHFLIHKSHIHNPILINWFADEKVYLMSIHIVKKRNPQYLLQHIFNKEANDSNDTKTRIIKLLMNVDPDVTTTNYRFSLLCPLGRDRMKTPVKSTKCDHLQCFDATTFIMMYEQKSIWICPICDNPCLFEDLRVQSYFSDVLMSPLLGDSNEIELLADGTWRVFDENNIYNAGSINSNDKPTTIIIDDDDDDGDDNIGSTQVCNVPKTVSSTVINVIDLTTSDTDEEN